MSTQPPQPSEEEIRAALEEEMRHLRVEDVVLQTVISLVNLGARRIGLAGGGPEEQDLEQGGLAVESVRRLLPLVEDRLGPDAKAIRDALSQLQLAFVRAGGRPPAGEEGTPAAEPAPGQPAGEEPDSAVKTGRLWVPGQ